jgi:hypothetical protein
MTWDEAKVCGSTESTPDGQPCDGEGELMGTGEKAKYKVRYMRCKKCKATWQVTFKPAEPRDDFARTPAAAK